MAIEQTIYSTATLLGTLRELPPPSNYWLDLCFPRVVNSDDEYIDFGKLDSRRRIAPLVVPTAQGKPIYSAAERVFRVKPAYVKPKDPITATRMIKKHAGQNELLGPRALSPQARYNAIVADIMATHREAIERRWEWMAAQAILNGSVVLEDDAYPRVLVDFQRDSGNTVVLSGAARWGEAGVSILNDIETWRTQIRVAKFGGPTNRLTIGAGVWEIMRNDQEIKDAMKTDTRATYGVQLNLGMREGLEAEFVGRLAGTLDVWVYSDFYEDYLGTTVPFMHEYDAVLTGPNVQGIRAFGAIQDVAANFQPLAIFPKMWNQEDPSATFIMNQSAPLMVPLNPNNTFRARVR